MYLISSGVAIGYGVVWLIPLGALGSQSILTLRCSTYSEEFYIVYGGLALEISAEFTVSNDTSLIVARILDFGFVEANGLRATFGYKTISRFIHIFLNTRDYAADIPICSMGYSCSLENHRLLARYLFIPV